MLRSELEFFDNYDYEQKGMICPKCKYEFEEEESSFATMWGDQPDLVVACPNCDIDLIIQEFVARKYEVSVKE